jgi:GTPase SAR1 family protein
LIFVVFRKYKEMSTSKFDEITDDASCRYSDSVSGTQEILPPIQGYEDQPLVSLEEAVKPLLPFVPRLDQMVWTVRSRCNQAKDNLSKDESASIMLYTLEWPPPEKTFYAILNEKLRLRNRRHLIPWFAYLRLFIHALSKLPNCSYKVIYRGVKLDLRTGFPEGQDVIWWSFSSCTSSLGVLDDHIGKVGKRTIFNITFDSAKDISRHSYYPEEKEVLFYPGRQFIVDSILDTGNDLHIIQLVETKPPFPLFQMPTTDPTPSSIDQSINILLIGEKGVGKSTFINAFVNYLSFRTVEQAQASRPAVVKPLSFRMMTNDTFEERTCTFGDFNHRDQSMASSCQTYTLDLRLNDGKKLCLIDTPSLVDASELDHSNTNTIKHILDYVNKLSHLNAVCFLLQPDASQLMTSFQSCFGQLMNRLGRNARDNVIFCFTNALMTFSMPGSTAPLLRKMFESHSMNDIPFSRDNTFFFENESFRYLVAVRNGTHFNYEDAAEYTSSWSDSVKESNRLLNYIHRRPVYRIVKR